MLQTVRVPINLLIPRSSSLGGNAGFWPVALTVPDAPIWQFLKDVDSKIYGFAKVPPNLALTPNARIIMAIGANATSGVTRLKTNYKLIADAISYNPATFDGETSQDITVPATARLRKDVLFPSSGSLAITPVAKDLLIAELFHEGAHVNDTLAVNTELLGAWLECDVTMNAYADARAHWCFPYGAPLEFGITAAAVGANNQVRCARLYLPFRITVDRVIWRNGTGSGNIGVAIYSSDGNTRLVTTGAVVGATGVQSVDITNVTLDPGFYWLAWTADNTTNTFAVTSAGGSLLVTNDTVVQAGTAANASAAGVPPTTLGAITSADVGCLFCKIQS